jgi:threonine aldolase
MVGGGMRQAGVIAAAGIVALQKMVDRLAEDHITARRLAYGLAHIPGISICPETVQTNIVIFDSPTSISGPEFIQRMDAQDVRFINRDGRRVRAVTHRMVSAADIDEALERIDPLVRELG